MAGMDELGFLTALHRPGLIVDAGAHDGLLALPLARLPGARVLAFEPLPAAFARLVTAGAGLPNLEARPQALGDAPGELALTVPVVDGVALEQWASTVKDFAAHPHVGRQRVMVPVVTLDSLALPQLSALKIDAEGAEYEVLRGARQTLRRCRPLLTLELEERHRAGATWAVPAFLDALDYVVCFAHAGRWWPATALDRPTMQRASTDPADYAASDPYIFNFFAWPLEQDEAVRQRLPHPG